MSDITKHYVAVLPDDTEYADEVRFWSHSRSDGVESARRQFAEAAVRHAKLETSRQNPQPVKVKLFVLEIEKGKLVRRSDGSIEITPPLRRMTEEEFQAEMDEVLSEVPNAFRPYVRQQAWEEGHSSGFEEVINYARGTVAALKPAVAAYRQEQKETK